MINTRLTSNLLLTGSLVIFALILSESNLKAQNSVGIGTPTPNSNAVLDLVSPNGNQGLLVPRITTTQRQGMAPSLGNGETGLVVFDTDLKQFYHWVDTTWVVGLGAFSDIAGGDLQGNYPNPTLRSDVVNSATILDGSIATVDLEDISVTVGKVDAEGNSNAILGTDASGVPRWEPKSDFLGNGLLDGTILIGDAANIAQPRNVTGDISMTNDGTTTISDNVINSAKILDDAITASDIGTDAIGSDELATGAAGSDEIADGSIQSVDIATGAITTSNIADGTVETADIASGGNDKVMITTAAGTVFWENITLFETSTLSEGSIFVGDVSNTAAALIAKGSGRILIGDGTSVQSLSVNGDINLSATGNAQINSGVVGSTEVTDNSLSRDDLAPNAVESSELADNAVDNGAIQDNAVSTAKIEDSAINNQKIASDAVTSAKITDGTIATVDLADDAVGTAKIDGEGSSNAVMTTTAAGNPQWESRSNFGTSNLPNANIFIGDTGGTSQPRPVSGDITLSNAGIVQINNDVIGTNEVTDNSITLDDIGPNAVESSELADNAVDTGAIQTNAVTTGKISDNAVTNGKISDNAVTTAKIDGSGNNDAILTTDGAGNPQWEAKSGLDIDPTNEIQDLSLAGNTLGLTGDPTTVDLAGYLDNTDSQDLTLAGNTLGLTGDATTVDLSGYLDNTDSQDLTEVLSQGNDAGGSAITNVADPTSAQDVATKNYVDALDAADNDGDPSNEIQDLSLAGNILALTSDPSTVDLSGYMDNTDSQDLTLAGNTLGLTGDATTVDLSGYLDNTDSQNLSNVLGQGNDAGAVKIVNVADPTNPQDVATMTYVDNITITGANMGSNSVSSNNIVNGSITSADIGAGEVSNPDIEDGAVNSIKIEDLSILNVDISNIANIAASKLQSTVMVEGENVSLLTNDAGYLSAVTSADITNGTIANIDINGSAAIDGSKINPDFGNQNIQTTGTLNSGAATVSSITVTNLGGANDTYTGDGAVNSFTISPGGAFSSSDIRLKTNIHEIPRALDKINLIEGKSYSFKSDQEQQLHFGVIAQDLQRLFPNLVRENEDGYLSVNYLELIPVLIEALKEQQQIIQELAQALKQGKELNNELKVGLNKQQKLVRTQQFILTQLQMDRAAMEKDIKEIKQSLGLEAKK